jgi:RNA polymerase sigma-70 factor, ECF subfamily
MSVDGYSERVSNLSDHLERSSHLVGASGELATGTLEGPSCANWTDAALVAGVALRSEGAYAELYRRHFISIAAVARMILGSGPGCEEVVDDVFVALWLSPQDFDPARGSLLGFLRLKTKCRSIDVVRSESSRARREQRDSYNERPPVAEIESALLNSERASELRLAVSSLPPVERDAIQLAFFSGMTYQAVAVHLNVAEGTVKSRIRSGLRRLAASNEVRVHREVQTLAARDKTRGAGSTDTNPGDL